MNTDIKPNTVVIIEDDEYTSKNFKALLEKEGYPTISFLNFGSADDFIFDLVRKDAQNICAVIFDYQLDQMGRFTSEPLVHQIKRVSGFTGIMLANSSDRYYNSLLSEAGCTHVRSKEYRKEQGAHYLLRLLKNLE